jgi:Na+/H+-dicarboxylate symporter
LVAPSTAFLVDAWESVLAKATGFLPLILVLAFAGGIFLGAVSEGLSNLVNTAAGTFVEGYSYGAPVLIFLVLAPVLSRIFSARQRGKFGLYVVTWLGATKIFALLWAAVFTVAAFGLPLLPENSVSVSGALVQTSKSLLMTLTTSQFFWAIYIAIIVGLVAIKVKPLAAWLEKGVSVIEQTGQYMQPMIPLFMFAVGIYVQSIPQQVAMLEVGGDTAGLERLWVAGFSIEPGTTGGMVAVYLVGALLVAVACFAWHFGILAMTKYKCEHFSVRDYFSDYWVKAYPLLWATSSESLATPLNLHILKENAPWVRPTVRRIVIGAGSVLCTNGTLICAIILLGLVGSLLGLHFSLLELLLAIPVAFLISFGIPGIPGELLLFAGPLSMVLGVPPEIIPVFLALYLGLQVGLPDSFRTGGNTTNNYLYCILLNEVYVSRFLKEEPQPI